MPRGPLGNEFFVSACLATTYSSPAPSQTVIGTSLAIYGQAKALTKTVDPREGKLMFTTTVLMFVGTVISAFMAIDFMLPVRYTDPF